MILPVVIAFIAISLLSTAETSQTHGMFSQQSEFIDRHNYGYVLKRGQDVTVATYHAKLIFHLDLPDWQVELDDHGDCADNRNWTLPCIQLREALDAIRDIRYHTQLYIQQQIGRIYEVVMDLPTTSRRTRRGFWTDALSSITGLASKDQVHAVTHILEQIQKGIYESARLWGDGARSLTAAFKVEQHRMRNVFQILNSYRRTIRDIQFDFMRSRELARKTFRWHTIVVARSMHFMSNTTLQLMEIEALYQGVQSLMAGSLSHFILPHESLVNALDHVQNYLTENQPHMTLCHKDVAFYYNQAAFRTFRNDLTLFLVVDVPITTDSLAYTFQLYDVIKLPLPTPETHDYYCKLATEITTIGYSADADHIIQMSNHLQPSNAIVWQASDTTLTFIDRNRPSCVRALVDANLPELKATCRYKVYKPPYPRSVDKLFGNTFLLTNISQLRLHCPQQLGNNSSEQVLDLHEIQTIHKFDCHCDRIHADEFRIIPDLNYCNDSKNISDVSTVHYSINLAYLSEYFSADELYNLTAQSLLNHSIEIQLPNLAVADKFLDERFADEESAAFDMEMVINSTKSSAQVYDNLAHYLFNQMVKAHDSQSQFDLLSPFTWVTIFSWITSIVALALVIILRIRMHSLTMMMTLRTVQAAPTLPGVISMTHPTVVTESAVDVMKEWVKHMDNITELVPIEVMILMCLLMWFTFKVARILYNARRAQVAKTRLLLEIGNGTDMILLHITDLPHTARYYRLIITEQR